LKVSAVKYVRSVVTFVKAARAGSFTAAAAALGVSPAAVSKSVQSLERQLGTRLFNRSTRRLALTEEGSVFFGHCQSAMLELENAVSAMVERRHQPAGLLRVTAAALFGRRHILPLLSEFAARYPKVTLDVTLDDRFVDMLLEGYDVSVRVSTPPVGTLIARRIVPIQAIVCGSPAYLKRHPVPRRPEDLLDHNCIRFRSVGNQRILEWEFQKDGTPFAQEVSGNLILTDPEGISQAVVDGRGLGQIPSFLAVPLMEEGKLKPVLLDYLSQSRAVYVGYSTRKYAAPRISAFVDFLVEKLAGDPRLLLGSRRRR
jgi:DNA-binding transcriptional LysR family regulator